MAEGIKTKMSLTKKNASSLLTTHGRRATKAGVRASYGTGRVRVRLTRADAIYTVMMRRRRN